MALATPAQPNVVARSVIAPTVATAVASRSSAPLSAAAVRSVGGGGGGRTALSSTAALSTGHLRTGTGPPASSSTLSSFRTARSVPFAPAARPSSASGSPPPVTASASALSLTSTASSLPTLRRASSRVSLSERAVLRDVALISDWLLSVEQSAAPSAFAGVIAKVKRAIFTPEQVKRTRMQQAQQRTGGKQHSRLSSQPVQPVAAAAGRSGPSAKALPVSGEREHRERGEHKEALAVAALSTVFLPAQAPTVSSSFVGRGTALSLSASSPSSTPSTSASPSSASSPHSSTRSRPADNGADDDDGGEGFDADALPELEEKLAAIAATDGRLEEDGTAQLHTRAHRVNASIGQSASSAQPGLTGATRVPLTAACRRVPCALCASLVCVLCCVQPLWV